MMKKYMETINNIKIEASKTTNKKYDYKVDFINDPGINPRALIDTLNIIETKDNQTIESIFRKQYSYILDEAANKENYLNIFTNENTLNIFASVLSNSRYSYKDRMNVNRICATFTSFCPKEKIELLYPKMINTLAYRVNIKDVKMLMHSSCLQNDQCIEVALLRYHDKSDYINYKAVNDYLLTLSTDRYILSPVDYINIYENLAGYNKVNISTLVNVAMLNPYKGNDKIKITADLNMLQGVMLILDECPTRDIKHVLGKYNSESLMYQTRPGGLEYYCFGRANHIIDSLKQEYLYDNGYYIM